MKRKTRKIMTFIMCLIMCLSNITPIMAANKTIDSIGSNNQEDDGVNVGVDKTQTQQTMYSEDIEEEGSQNTNVYVSQASTFGVFIPKTIVLAGEKDENGLNTADYVVSVSSFSNINGTETINVVPEESFQMTSYGKNPIVANVTQDKTSWKYNELDVKANGVVYTSDMTAGMWNGSFMFNINLKQQEFGPGLYDANNVLIASWDTLVDDYGLNITVENHYPSTSHNGTLSKILTNNEELKNGKKLIIKEGVSGLGDFNTAYIELDEIVFPASITDLEHSDFVYSKIKQITVHKNNQTYCSIDGVLYDKNIETVVTYPTHKNATSYIPPSTVKTIGDGAFRNNEYLETITLPENVITIKEYAFENCKKLKNLSMTNNITTIENSAFSMNYNIEKITLSENITYIAPHLLYGCEKLKEVNIPNKVTNIGEYAFYGCDNLKNIEIPDNVTYIGDRAFASTGIETIYIPISVETIGDRYSSNDGIVLFCSPSLIIYCGASEKQPNWVSDWNYLSMDDGPYYTMYNVTREEYETLYKK